MHRTNKGRLFLLLSCILPIAACTIPPLRQSEITVTGQISPSQPPHNILQGAIFLEETPQASVPLKALSESLRRQAWLADSPKSAFLLLKADFLKPIEDTSSLKSIVTFTVKTTTQGRYVLVERATGQAVLEEYISGVGIAGLGDEPYLNVAQERSYRDNILKFMQRADLIARQTYDRNFLVRKFEAFNIFGETSFFDAYPPERLGYSRSDFLRENFSRKKANLAQAHPDNLRKFRNTYASYIGYDDLRYIDDLIQSHVVAVAKPAEGAQAVEKDKPKSAIDEPVQGVKGQAAKRHEKSAATPPKGPAPVANNPNPF